MRRRLALVSAAVTAMVVLAFVIPLAGLVRSLARDRVLVTAEREAQTQAQALGVVLPEAGIDGARVLVGSGKLPNDELLTVTLSDGTMLGAEVPFDGGFARAAEGEAFRQRVTGGEAIFVPVFLAGEPFAVVRVFVTQEELTRNVGASWAVLGALGIALVGLAALVADRLARSIVEPVLVLSTAAHRMGEGDLDATVEPAGPPEVIEVGHAFNRLGSRIRTLISEERESVADLSHRLRTPLTALRLDVGAIDDSEVAARIAEDLDDLERTVDHVINEARRQVREGPGVLADVASIVRDRLEFWGALAEDQGRRWSSDLDSGPLRTAAHAGDIAAALDALLGNVLAHTPDGVPYSVSLHPVGRFAVLTIEDRGSGFSDQAVVERGTSSSGSTGLGLDIVRRTAEASGGDLDIGRSVAGGARAIVRFGLTDF
ncbi:MAG: HAMP domain-containing histidine kinase [Acidimicrobiia bacterium]|nr:HAMP domain-containing histidine kinase [Acidimicrobiia bacterium]MDH3396826.1 HAMP domain-containing histidine kinase [Acidimicrobiia bacterium]